MKQFLATSHKLFSCESVGNTANTSQKQMTSNANNYNQVRHIAIDNNSYIFGAFHPSMSVNKTVIANFQHKPMPSNSELSEEL